MEIVLATGNSHKVEELSQILSDHTLLTPADLNLQFSFDETGITYYENSFGKAKALYKLCGKPVMADDSGLSVNAMDGAPGIYSARYGAEDGENLTDKEKYELLLKNMEGNTDRRASFVCCMVLILDEYRIYSVQETMDGQLAEKPSGSGGFGYDPVMFIPEKGRMVAELSPDEKNSISHRGKAGQLMKQLIKDL